MQPDQIAARAAHYRLQAAAHAQAVGRATARTVSSIACIFGALDNAIVRLNPADVRSAISELQLRLLADSYP